MLGNKQKVTKLDIINHLAKAMVSLRGQEGWFWEPSSRQRTESLTCNVIIWPYSDNFSHEYVKNLSIRELRMRKQNTKRAVPLDAVPERRTKRCPPRFRPADRFCELSFRYLTSPAGSEGEICRPLYHMWQIPFIHSVRFIYGIKYCIYRTVFQIHPPCGTFKRVLVSRISYKCARALRKHSFRGSIPLLKGSWTWWAINEIDLSKNILF